MKYLKKKHPNIIFNLLAFSLILCFQIHSQANSNSSHEKSCNTVIPPEPIPTARIQNLSKRMQQYAKYKVKLDIFKWIAKQKIKTLQRSLIDLTSSRLNNEESAVPVVHIVDLNALRSLRQNLKKEAFKPKEDIDFLLINQRITSVKTVQERFIELQLEKINLELRLEKIKSGQAKGGLNRAPRLELKKRNSPYSTEDLAKSDNYHFILFKDLTDAQKEKRGIPVGGTQTDKIRMLKNQITSIKQQAFEMEVDYILNLKALEYIQEQLSLYLEIDATEVHPVLTGLKNKIDNVLGKKFPYTYRAKAKYLQQILKDEKAVWQGNESTFVDLMSKQIEFAFGTPPKESSKEALTNSLTKTAKTLGLPTSLINHPQKYGMARTLRDFARSKMTQTFLFVPLMTALSGGGVGLTSFNSLNHETIDAQAIELALHSKVQTGIEALWNKAMNDSPAMHEIIKENIDNPDQALISFSHYLSKNHSRATDAEIELKISSFLKMLAQKKADLEKTKTLRQSLDAKQRELQEKYLDKLKKGST